MILFKILKFNNYLIWLYYYYWIVSMTNEQWRNEEMNGKKLSNWKNANECCHLMFMSNKQIKMLISITTFDSPVIVCVRWCITTIGMIQWTRTFSHDSFDWTTEYYIEAGKGWRLTVGGGLWLKKKARSNSYVKQNCAMKMTNKKIQQNGTK